MRVITNYTARAGAEAVLSRLLRASVKPALIVSAIDIADSNRRLVGYPIRDVPLKPKSLDGAMPVTRRLWAGRRRVDENQALPQRRCDLFVGHG